MPLIKRPVEPINITRNSDGEIPPGVSNELEYKANLTQANLIRQLSSLSRHAEDMFTELFQEASVVYGRACMLQTRVSRIEELVSQLDPNVEPGMSMHAYNVCTCLYQMICGVFKNDVTMGLLMCAGEIERVCSET